LNSKVEAAAKLLKSARFSDLSSSAIEMIRRYAILRQPGLAGDKPASQ
jgi:hypothetical protein